MLCIYSVKIQTMQTLQTPKTSGIGQQDKQVTPWDAELTHL